MTYIRITLSLLWFTVAIVAFVLIIATAFLFGMWVVARLRDKERERLELENAKLMCKVEHYKREHREAMNMYAAAANEAARLKGAKIERERKLRILSNEPGNQLRGVKEN